VLPRRKDRALSFLTLVGPLMLSRLSVSRKPDPVPTNAILREARQLHSVSDRLDSLAERHPLVSEALNTISGNVRRTATLLEVLVMTRMGPPAGPADA
jgi:hypothetical protein